MHLHLLDVVFMTVNAAKKIFTTLTSYNGSSYYDSYPSLQYYVPYNEELLVNNIIYE